MTEEDKKKERVLAGIAKWVRGHEVRVSGNADDIVIVNEESHGLHHTYVRGKLRVEAPGLGYCGVSFEFSFVKVINAHSIELPPYAVMSGMVRITPDDKKIRLKPVFANPRTTFGMERTYTDDEWVGSVTWFVGDAVYTAMQDFDEEDE